MNDKHQENGTLSGPLILTLPASNFIAILRPDWLNGTDQTAFPDLTAKSRCTVPVAWRFIGKEFSGLGQFDPTCAALKQFHASTRIAIQNRQSG